MTGPLKITALPGFKNSSMVVGWGGDAGRLGEAVTDYLIDKLDGRLYCEIDPSEYFPLGGVSIEDDLVQFPVSQFYVCPDHNLVIFKSDPPCFELYQFFQQVLDIAEQSCHVKEVYSIGGIVSMYPHTIPRQLLGAFSSVSMKERFRDIDIESDLNYETPMGQKPTLNTYLLWVIRNRKISGANLLIPVPFYFLSLDDPKAQKRILEFFNKRFRFGFDLREFDEDIKSQNQLINEARDIYPEIDEYFGKLESNLRLSEDENMKLVKMLEEYLKAKGSVF